MHNIAVAKPANHQEISRLRADRERLKAALAEAIGTIVAGEIEPSPSGRRYAVTVRQEKVLDWTMVLRDV